MKKNVALVLSWCITLGLLVGSYVLLRGFMSHNADLRNLRADLYLQQVSMRQNQVEIAKRIEGVDEITRREVVDLLLESATEVDVLRDQNRISNGNKELEKLKEALEQAYPQHSRAGDRLKATHQE